MFDLISLQEMLLLFDCDVSSPFYTGTQKLYVIFSVMVAEKHILNPKSEGKPFPYTLVTVLVDKIDFSEYLPKVIKQTSYVLSINRYSSTSSRKRTFESPVT